MTRREGESSPRGSLRGCSFALSIPPGQPAYVNKSRIDRSAGACHRLADWQTKPFSYLSIIPPIRLRNAQIDRLIWQFSGVSADNRPLSLCAASFETIIWQIFQQLANVQMLRRWNATRRKGRTDGQAGRREAPPLHGPSWTTCVLLLCKNPDEFRRIKLPTSSGGLWSQVGCRSCRPPRPLHMVT